MTKYVVRLNTQRAVRDNVTDVPVHPMAVPPVHMCTMWGAAEKSSTW
jgi:hypothetical protein